MACRETGIRAGNGGGVEQQRIDIAHRPNGAVIKHDLFDPITDIVAKRIVDDDLILAACEIQHQPVIPLVPAADRHF